MRKYNTIGWVDVERLSFSVIWASSSWITNCDARYQMIVGRTGLLLRAYHGQHPSLRSVWKWPSHQRHREPCRWLCIERIDPLYHKWRCHMHPVPCVAAKRDLQICLVLHPAMDHEAAALKYRTLKRKSIRGSSIRMIKKQTHSRCRGEMKENVKAGAAPVRVTNVQVQTEN